MSLEKILKFKGMSARYPIAQGGMGIGVSLYELCTSVGLEGGIPTLSSVALDQFTRKRLLALGEEVVDVLPGRMDFVEATRREISDIKKISGDVAINVMCALPLYYEKSLEGAILGGVNMIVSGAGLPSALPSQVKNITGTNDHFINLVPIISSARALNILIKKWDAQGYRPDAVVLEGPKAGGHLGWNYKQIENSEDFLKEYDVIEHLLPEVLDVANRYRNDFGPIPVIVAGGVYTTKMLLTL
jgi:nitronate monooxygenase